VADRPGSRSEREEEARQYEPPAVEDIEAPDGAAVTAAAVVATTQVHVSAPREV